MDTKNKQPASAGRILRLVRGLRWWLVANCRSVRTLAVDLPAYAWGNLHPFRDRTKPSVPRLLLGERKWITILRWELPRLAVSVMDGMGEHYGYPRHFAYVIFWWNRRGYAWGVEYSTNSPISGGIPSASSDCSKP